LYDGMMTLSGIEPLAVVMVWQHPVSTWLLLTHYADGAFGKSSPPRPRGALRAKAQTTIG
jgi:hypothetical protein